MFIIFGSRGREVTEQKGQFNCPKCCAQENITYDAKQHAYEQIKVARYFTLFFIPIFSYSTLGRYIKCTQCSADYNESVLTYVPPTFAEQISDYVSQELQSGTPVTILINKLKSQGFTPEQAEEAVNTRVGDNRVTCSHCKMDFLDSVEKCSLCEQRLHSH